MKIFISHPYADNPKENTKQINAICKALLQKGIVAISPLHMFSYMSNDDYRQEIMSTCYTLIEEYPLMRTRGSKGCDKELQYAKEMGQEIHHLEDYLSCYALIKEEESELDLLSKGYEENVKQLEKVLNEKLKNIETFENLQKLNDYIRYKEKEIADRHEIKPNFILKSKRTGKKIFDIEHMYKYRGPLEDRSYYIANKYKNRIMYAYDDGENEGECDIENLYKYFEIEDY